MPRYIVGHKGLYFEFSTVSDSPSSYVMTREEFKDWYAKEYGQVGLRELPERMARVDAKGTSCVDDSSAYDTVRQNRADHGEKHLSLKQILIQYRLRADVPEEA